MAINSMVRALIIAIAVINIQALPLGIEQVNFPKSVFLFTLAGVLFGVLIASKELLRRVKTNQVFWFGGSFVLALLWAAISTDANIHRILFGELTRANGILTYISLILILIFTAISFQKSQSEFLINSLIVTAGIQATIAFFQFSEAESAGERLSINPMQGTFGNPNFLSAFIALGALAATSYLIDAKSSTSRKVISALFVIAILATVIRSDSQQGLIVYAAGLVPIIAYLIQNRFESGKLLGIYFAFVLTGFATFLAGLFQIGPAARIVYQDSVGLRIEYWSAAWSMFTENFLTGVGIASYGDYFLTYRSAEQIALSGEATTSSNDAHNIFLQLAATGGLFLAVTYLVLVAFIFWRAWKAYQLQQSATSVVTLTAIWTGYTAQSLLSLNQIGLAIWGWLIAGAIVALSYELSALKFRDSKFVVSTVLIGIVGFSLAQSENFKTQYKLKSIFTTNVGALDETGRAELLNELFERSDSLQDPEVASYVIAQIAKTGSTQKQEELLVKYAAEFPNSVELQVQAAEYFEGIEDFASSRVYREKSIELDPLNQELKDKLAAYPSK